ncbi:MAG: DinB family protein [Acidobacteria bacterium]|nr:DinB family protein [Acidobacteriota bacterium]MCA1608754.1 DinB family protein [Acidobacteriota bacterium]
MNFRAAPNRWTIAEVAEHIIVSEGTILGLVRDRMLKMPAPPAGKDDYRVKDVGVRLAITNRTQKFQAPEILKPNSRFKTREELLTNFGKARNEVIDFVKTTKEDLRGRFVENPMMGVIDAHQWILFLAGHSDRHLAQLKEVKTDAAYPKK